MDMSDFWARGVAVDGARNLTRLNLDPDILHWFQQKGEGFTRQINQVLCAYMETHETMELPHHKLREKEAPTWPSRPTA